MESAFSPTVANVGLGKSKKENNEFYSAIGKSETVIKTSIDNSRVSPLGKKPRNSVDIHGTQRKSIASSPPRKQSSKPEPVSRSPKRKQSQDDLRMDKRKLSVGKLPPLTDRKLDKSNKGGRNAQSQVRTDQRHTQQPKSSPRVDPKQGRKAHNSQSNSPNRKGEKSRNIAQGKVQSHVPMVKNYSTNKLKDKAQLEARIHAISKKVEDTKKRVSQRWLIGVAT
jgi:hypothetical protein